MAQKPPAARGGARPGAGRKPDLVKAEAKSFFERMTPHADSLLERALTDEETPWKIRMQAVEVVYAYRYGKPRQQLDINASMQWVGMIPQAAMDALN